MLCFAPTLSLAKRLVRQGADALVIEGAEAGGHPGMDMIGTMVQGAIVPHELEVPVVLEFKATAETADSLFMNAMQLIGRVLRDHWHIDVVSTQARGDGEQLLSLSVDAQVWVRDRYGFVDLTLLQAAAANAQETLE